MEITKQEYQKAFVDALEAEMKELQERNINNMASLLLSISASAIVRRMETAFFGEEDFKDG